MHSSSFYELRARYVYTPLYGPYSLSEALEGLLFYSLNESRDSIAIGSKRTLRHELIFELSNVVDDLQEYLHYFSSTFLISPLNSPDFIKELQAGYGRFEHLTVYWGALISRLIIARGIIEHNFWPHLFHPGIFNPSAFQGLGQPPSSTLSNASLEKSFASTFTSAFTLPSHIYSTPHSLYYPLESQHLPLNVQSKRSQRMPSKTDLTVGEENRMSSLKLNTMTTPSGLHPSRAPSSCQLSDSSLTSHVPQIFED